MIGDGVQHGGGLAGIAAAVMAAGGDVLDPGPMMEGKARPWSLMGGSADRTPEEQAADRRAGFLPMTDLGNAERWHLRHGQDFRYCPELGWLAWDGRRWSRENAETRLMDSVFSTVRAVQFEATARAQLGEAWRAKFQALKDDLAKERITAEDFDAAYSALGDDPDPVVKRARGGEITRASETLHKWGRTSEGQARIKAIAEIVVSLVTVPLEALDADQWALNLMNGTLRIERVKGDGARIKLCPHRREDLISMLAPITYDPSALCPRYDAFLERVQPDEGVRRFLHAWGGYTLTGDTGEQKFVINYGPLGANGKSTWSAVLARMMGDYALTVNIAVFMDVKMQNGNSPSPAMAELPRKRMVTTSEPEKGQQLAESLMKQLTGGEPMQARHLNKPFFRFLPEFKWLASQNPMPALSADGGIWRRAKIVGWLVQIPEDEREGFEEFLQKLMTEASGILNRLLAGLDYWCAYGLPKAKAVDDVTAAVRDARDPLGRFLRVATVPDPEGKIAASVLHRAHAAWAVWDGEKGWSEKGLAGAMRDKGFEQKKISSMFWMGLRLVRPAECFAEERADGSLRRRDTLGPRTDGVGDEWDALPPDAGGEREDFVP